MHKGRSALVALIGSVLSCGAQVLAPAEITDPGMRALQQKHLPELKAAAVDISSHEYPYRFFLSRTLDITEQQEQVTDQRSIRFSDFQGRTVLQVTGNYFAAYSDRYMNQNERVKRTYLDVVLPILRATAPRLQNEAQLTGFAIEISHHVRKQVIGVAVERPENVALIVPHAAAAKAVMSTDLNDEIAALKESTVYVDGKPVALWPDGNTEASPVVTPVSAVAPTKPAAVESMPVSAPPVQIVEHQAARDLSVEALQRQQVSQQELLDRIARELEPQAHFVAYAPPALIAFHNATYLQLSITTTLAPSDSGSQYRLAALAFDRHMSHLVRPLLAFFKQDPEFEGVVFSSTVRVPGDTAESTLTQSVELFLPFRALRRFEQFDITGQQLIDSGFVLINGERVGLELQSAESERR